MSLISISQSLLAQLLSRFLGVAMCLFPTWGEGVSWAAESLDKEEWDFKSLFLEIKSRSYTSSSTIILGCIALLNYVGDTFSLWDVLVNSCYGKCSSLLIYSLLPKAGEESWLKFGTSASTLWDEPKFLMVDFFFSILAFSLFANSFMPCTCTAFIFIFFMRL